MGVGMYFNVSRLMKEPSGSRRSFKVNDELSVEAAEAHRVTGTANLLRTDAGIWVSAALDSEAPCTCSRCLRECTQHIHMAIEEEFLPLADSETGTREGGLDDSVGSSGIDQDNILDLSEAVRQYYSLNMPMKPVCRDDCKGMCLTCGADLNNSPCQCDNSSRDMAWGRLLELVPSNKSTEVYSN